jgi:glutamate synthase domain-containing protein 3
MGARKLDDIIGRTDLLGVKSAALYPKTQDVDLTPLFYSPGQIKAGNNKVSENGVGGTDLRPEPINPGRSLMGRNDRPADWRAIDETILQEGRDAISDGRVLTLYYPIKNTDRTVGGRIAGEIAYRYGDKGLPDNTLILEFTGSAGQSFGAFNIHGMRLNLTGEANDYVGKGMHGGTITVKPHARETYVWHENSIIGNTVMYGATGGAMFAAGRAGERFCVRNSGGTAVVEGVGDHGCEYMTGGTVVVLGDAGRNFGAGMSGGTAYVFDEHHTFERRFNPDMVGITRIENEDNETLRALVERHAQETGSPRAKELLGNWDNMVTSFWKVTPHPETTPSAPQQIVKTQSGALMDGTGETK